MLFANDCSLPITHNKSDSGTVDPLLLSLMECVLSGYSGDKVFNKEMTTLVTILKGKIANVVITQHQLYTPILRVLKKK